MTDVSVLELFRVEAENQVALISQGLIDLERDAGNPALLESLMRAAHSIKGAARIVKLPVAVTLAHAMEDCFTALQKGASLPPEGFDTLLEAADRFGQVARVEGAELVGWLETHAPEFDALAASLRRLMTASPVHGEEVPPSPAAAPTDAALSNPQPGASTPASAAPSATSAPTPDAPTDDRILRVNAEHLDRMMGLAAEALVESRRLGPFSRSLLRLRRQQHAVSRLLDEFHERLRVIDADDHTVEGLREIQRHMQRNRELLARQETQAGTLDQRLTRLAQDLYREATASRMRPFSDGIAGFPRMVRDLARELRKDVRLEISGATTQVDRDILEKLLAPLNHLVRNAVDHGIESPAERLAVGKPAGGTIWLDARHHAGMLQVTIRDDGRGIDTEALRREVVRRGLVATELGRELSDAELFEFLYLPNFTLSPRVTEISGRGVGLDVVLSAVQQVRGTMKTLSNDGQGACFQLQVPQTLSVLRSLIVRVAEETYAFPLARVERVLSLTARNIHSLEGREYFELNGASIGLISARQILKLPAVSDADESLRVVLLADHSTCFGLVVDQLLMECDLVVQPIDPVLGKIRNIAAATLLEDGTPALIFDVDDVIRSIDSLISSGRLSRAQRRIAGPAHRRKHILVVDDSFTVREVERKLLENRGYRVDIAVDGMDGWNTVRAGDYDLIVTDVDMPRMNGIELVALIKKDPLMKALPIMIVSYKDREEDRQRGLEAGADYYLAKSSFQDETLLEAVENLIGEA